MTDSGSDRRCGEPLPEKLKVLGEGTQCVLFATGKDHMHKTMGGITWATDSGSDNLRAALKAELSQHFPDQDQTACYMGGCACGWSGSEPDYEDHVADSVLPLVECRVAAATAPLEAKIAAVESIHFPRKMTISGDNKMTLCNQCSALSGNAYLPSSQWPCATVRALASGQEGEK